MGSLFGRFRRGDRGDDGALDAAPAPRLPEGRRFDAAGGARIYRAIEVASWTDPRTGKRSIFRSGVGSSDVSEAQAVMEARARAQRALENAVAVLPPDLSGYRYQVDRRLEPQVDSVRGPSGEVARVTVNSYGSLVVNADRAMFVDVDTGDERDESRDTELPEALRDLVVRRPDLGFRAYRTFAGWRYLCTTTGFDPVSSEVETLLAELGSDEKYMLLCRIQRTFRARLTPKPWRAHELPLPVGAAGVDRVSLQKLIDRTWRFATTRYIATAGSAVVSPDIEAIVAQHDLWTQAAINKPLA